MGAFVRNGQKGIFTVPQKKKKTKKTKRSRKTLWNVLWSLMLVVTLGGLFGQCVNGSKDIVPTVVSSTLDVNKLII